MSAKASHSADEAWHRGAGSHWPQELKSTVLYLVTKGSAVAAVACAQLIGTMSQEHHSGCAPVLPIVPGLPVQRALRLGSQPQGRANVEVHDCVRRAQQVCADTAKFAGQPSQKGSHSQGCTLAASTTDLPSGCKESGRFIELHSL